MNGEKQTGEMCWQLQPDWEQQLLEPGGLPLASWIRQGLAQVVKHGEHRTVYRVDLPSGAIYVKHYRCSSLGRASRSLVRASASRREYRKMCEVARRRVPTAHAIGFGELRRHGLVLDNYFVTEALAGAIPLDACLERDLPQRPVKHQAILRRRLTVALADLCAALHAAGVVQDDLHPGNVLVGWSDAADATSLPTPRLYLIDLPGVRLSRPLSWRAARDNLVMLYSGLAADTSRADRLRFWKHYLQARAGQPLAHPRHAARDIARRARDFACRNRRGRDARSLRNNRDFQAFHCEGWQVHAVAQLEKDWLTTWAMNPVALLQRYLHHPLKLSHTSVVVQAEVPLNNTCKTVALKHCQAATGWKRLLAPWRKSKAWRGWYTGHALAQRDIGTALPLAMLHRAGGDSYLMTEWIEGAENLHLYAWRLAEMPRALSEVRAQQTAHGLGQLLGRLHRWQIAHRDLKWGNLLAAPRVGAVETAIIDLDGVKIRRHLSDKQRCSNLARFAASLVLHPAVRRGHCRRFLQAYLHEYAEGEDWKTWWRMISAASQELVRRKRRRGWRPG